MQILMLTDQQPDYLADSLYDGFARTTATIIDYPNKLIYHRNPPSDDETGWIRGTWNNQPEHGLTREEIREKLRGGAFSCMIVSSDRGEIPELYQEFRAISTCPLVLLDGRDQEDEIYPWIADADLYLKRELIEEVHYCRHLNFAFPDSPSPGRLEPVPGKVIADRKYDVSFVGNLWAGRDLLVKRLLNQGLEVYVASPLDSWSEYEEVLRESKLVLNPHGFGHTNWRLFEALNYGAVPITENTDRTHPECTLWFDSDDMVQYVKSALQDLDALQLTRDRFYAEFRDSCLSSHSASKLIRLLRCLPLKHEFDRRVNTPTDIHQHLVALNRYALKCRHVTEFGMRTGESTSAFLWAMPEKLVSYDLEPDRQQIHHLKTLAQMCTQHFEFTQANDLEIEIEKTDLLFIDTLHTAEQLRQELAIHAGKVGKFIIMHDTAETTFGLTGENGGEGLLVAIHEFVEHNPRWEIAEQTEACNGLTVLARRGV